MKSKFENAVLRGRQFVDSMFIIGSVSHVHLLKILGMPQIVSGDQTFTFSLLFLSNFRVCDRGFKNSLYNAV